MTYIVLSVVVLAIIAVATLPVLRRLPARPLVLTALCLIALTVVFDNIIVGLGIVAYDEDLISGLTMPIAPIEDLAYAVGAVLLVPTLWELLGARRPGRRPATSKGDAAGAAGEADQASKRSAS
ncbi:lycopene cyclase domain-containing protein [Demequina globuliformis]|uniref:lycopene cyclase domain-containing protein n=1 Tax=Demequina globuliformis TaxID=676202 RepID=UPI0007866017|nr:lycopene cyclase domain-containing protein [Demequina globuliformis]